MEKESRLNDFLDNPYKSMWKMALPIIAGMMVQTLFNVVDIMFIGWLGADEVTAVAFVSPIVPEAFFDNSAKFTVAAEIVVLPPN